MSHLHDAADESRVTRKLPRAGDVVAGKYRVERVVGEGGMGVVFAAQHEVLGQRVALKVLLAEASTESDTVMRFLREAQAAASLQSEHVARVIDAGELESGLPFLAMEFLEGCDLAELVKLQGPLPIDEVCDFALQALEAVSQAHAAGIIHRDLKPSNLFLALRPDGTNTIKVLDFGIHKTIHPDGTKYKTLTGKSVLGSPAYMSPEQVRNARSVDTRSDIWSLGVVMYELLTKAIPFDGDGVGEILAAILEQDPARPRERRADLPEGLELVVLRCLRRSREERFQDAAELARAIAPFGSGGSLHLVERIEQTLTHAQVQVRTMTPAIAFSPQPAYGGPDVRTVDGPARTDASPSTEAIETSASRRTLRQGGLLVAAAGVFAVASIVAVTSFIVRTESVTTPANAALPPAMSAPPAPVTASASVSAPVLAPDVTPPAASASARPARARPMRSSAPAPTPTTPLSRPPILKSRE